jgi:alpha-D-xyloside xylohydrolase
MINNKTIISALRDSDLIVNSYVLSYEFGTIIIKGDSSFVYGLGERYNHVNQKNITVENVVIEHFCNQDDKTYFPLPFFFLEHNVGIYLNTKRTFSTVFQDDIIMDISALDENTELYIFTGTYKEIISDFITITGEQLLPPKWSLGPWMSAHRWNSQELIEQQLKTLKELKLPITSLVIEQWSDEATFYIFNGAKYENSLFGQEYEAYGFDENSLWPNPKEMIKNIHDNGLKVLLWQAPVIKDLEPHELENEQHTIDIKYVQDQELVIQLEQKPYRIPKGNWFTNSMVPDFTNPVTEEWWFDKRKYLFDIGIDGFKTDGGEFIHNLNTTFHNDLTGLEMKNDYSHQYIKAYKNNIDDNQVLFSRAGYIGQQSLGIQWAGDQKSTWDELRSIYKAGLSASLSGQHLWSFDIGGFAGELPSVELYIRSTQLAVFTPVMQFHSEPIGGQFALLDPSKVMNNERSPWNIANHYDREDIIPHLRELYWLRMNLLPYIYSEMLKAVKYKHTVMKHLLVDYPMDEVAQHISSEHLFGDILFVPTLKENEEEQVVYLPKGTWTDIFTNEIFEGENKYSIKLDLYRVLAFIPNGSALVLNNNALLSKTDNNIEDTNLHMWLYGNKGTYTFHSDDYTFEVSWNKGQASIVGDYPYELVIVFK